MRQERHSNPDDTPRSLGNPAVRQRRRALLDRPHMKPLNDYVAKLRRDRENVEVPDFDPLDGGIDALVLFLFEKPGPKTVGSTGSGFISRNNNDSTAEATFKFMQESGIPRELTVTWNVVPRWNGTIKVLSAELREGVECIKELIGLLPRLHAVVFVGKKADRARPYLEDTGLSLFSSAHPSPRVRASWPDRWHAIPTDWAKVKPALGLS